MYHLKKEITVKMNKKLFELKYNKDPQEVVFKIYQNILKYKSRCNIKKEGRGKGVVQLYDFFVCLNLHFCFRAI